MTARDATFPAPNTKCVARRQQVDLLLATATRGVRRAPRRRLAPATTGLRRSERAIVRAVSDAVLALRALLTFAYLGAEPVRRAIGLREQLDPFALGGPSDSRAQLADDPPPPKRSEERLRASGSPPGRRRLAHLATGFSPTHTESQTDRSRGSTKTAVVLGYHLLLS